METVDHGRHQRSSPPTRVAKGYDNDLNDPVILFACRTSSKVLTHVEHHLHVSQSPSLMKESRQSADVIGQATEDMQPEGTGSVAMSFRALLDECGLTL